MTELHSDTYAQALDAADPLRGLRDEFLIPQHDGREQAYFCGNSLGLQPRTARAHVEEVLDKWAHEAVEGHFTGQAQWMPYHRSEEHTSELQSLMRISYAVFCLKKKKKITRIETGKLEQNIQ